MCTADRGRSCMFCVARVGLARAQWTWGCVNPRLTVPCPVSPRGPSPFTCTFLAWTQQPRIFRPKNSDLAYFFLFPPCFVRLQLPPRRVLPLSTAFKKMVGLRNLCLAAAVTMARSVLYDPAIFLGCFSPQLGHAY